MKILISTVLSTKHKVGVTEYLIGLLNALQKFDNENEYYIITTKENRKFFSLSQKNFHEIIVNILDVSRAILRLQYLLFTTFRLPSFIKKYQIDFIHEPCSWFANKRIKTLVTIHDVIELKNLKYSFLFNYLKQKMILSSIFHATEIISVSSQTTKEIKNIYDRNIYTIPNGINFIKKADDETKLLIMQKYNLNPKQYFIFVGTLLKHKNLSSLLEAFKLFIQTHDNYKLVLAGKQANATKNIQNFIKKNKLQNKIVLTGYFEEKEKYPLIKHAKALLLISKEEGFGFPILEAQSLGVPVITSNASSMKEVAGEGAILVDPYSIHSIAEGLIKISSEEINIEKIISLGKQNIKRFSWDKTAIETMNVYKKFLIHINSVNNLL